MRRRLAGTQLSCALLSLALLATTAAEAQRIGDRFSNRRTYEVVLEMHDLSDRPCDPGWEQPAVGAEVTMTMGRFEQTRTSGRDGRAIFDVPPGDYQIAWTFGSRSWVLQDEYPGMASYPVSGDQLNALRIPARTLADSYDLTAEIDAPQQVRAGEPFNLRFRVRRTDADDATYVPEAETVLERSALLRRGWELVAQQATPNLCGPTGDWTVQELDGLPAGDHSFRVRIPGHDLDRRNNTVAVRIHSIAPTAPDLAVTATQSAATVRGGESITYSVQFANEGTAPAQAGLRMTLPPGLDLTTLEPGPLQCAEQPANLLGTPIDCSGGLDPGVTAAVSLTGTLPATAGAGNLLRFVARADPQEAVAESREDNNVVSLEALTEAVAPVEPEVYTISGTEFAAEALARGYSFRWHAVTSGATCAFEDDGDAYMTSYAFTGGVTTCRFSYFFSEPPGSLRLSSGWSIDSIGLMILAGTRSTWEWSTPLDVGSDNPFLSVEISIEGATDPVGSAMVPVASLGAVTLLGPPGQDWRQALP